MKKYILIAVAVIAFISINAQDNNSSPVNHRLTLGVDGGLALPGSDYGASSLAPSSINSTMSGYAKTGYCFDLYAGFRFFKSLGAMLQYGTNGNSYNAADIVSQARTASASGEYRVNEYLVGPYFTILSSKIRIEAKVLGGLVSSNYPTNTFTYNGFMNTYGESVVNSFKTGNGFGYCIGLKVKYLIGNFLGIGIGLNYVGTNINFKGTSTQEINNVPTESTPYSSKMGISILQPNIGLSLDI